MPPKTDRTAAARGAAVKTGESLVIKVPKGTVVREAETGRVLAVFPEMNQWW